MKKLFLCLTLIVSPVFAAEEVTLNLTADQQAACHEGGGCLVVTRAAAVTLFNAGVEQGRQDCKGVI